MVIFLYGPDIYRSKNRLNFLKQKFKKKYGQEKNLSISHLNPKKIKPEEINKYFFSQGLFTKKKLIIISSLFSPLNKRNNKKLNTLAKKLLNPVKQAAKKSAQDSNIIIFWDRNIKQKNLTQSQKKLFKYLKKLKHATKFKLLTNTKTKDWIKKRVKKQNAKITPKASQLLIDIYGNDLYALDNEIKKLSSFNLKNKLIDQKLINNLILANPKQEIWDLTDAVGDKNQKRALTLLENALNQGADINYIISMLGYQYRLILKIKSFQKNHSTKQVKKIANTLSIHPYPCKKALKSSQKYNLKEIKKIYAQLTNIDFLSKKSNVKAKNLLSLLIIKN